MISLYDKRPNRIHVAYYLIHPLLIEYALMPDEFGFIRYLFPKLSHTISKSNY